MKDSLKVGLTTTRRVTIDHDFLSAGEINELRQIETGLRALGELPFVGATIEKDVQSDWEEIGDADALWDWIDARARKGLKLQRYKGLGEMNPDQLWETTMNPEARTLKSVTIEDAASADKTFDMLMGNEVPPRRRFIQTHAKQVQNLDI